MTFRKTAALVGGLLLSASALAFADGACAQARGLPAPPMVQRPVLPVLPPCFQDQKAALDWINAAYAELKAIAHERQAVQDYIRRLQFARISASPQEQQAIARSIDAYQRADQELAAAMQKIEALIPMNLKVKYCPQTEAPKAAKPVRFLQGSVVSGGPSVRVYVNEDGTRTVERDENGVTSSTVREASK